MGIFIDTMEKRRQAERFIRFGQDQKAHAVFDELLEYNPNHFSVLEDKADLYARNPKEREKAKEFYDRALELDPDNVRIMIKFAESSFSYEVHPANLRVMWLMHKAIRISPQLEKAWCILGIVKITLKQWEDAEKCFGKALGINPENKRALENLLKTRELLDKERRNQTKIR